VKHRRASTSLQYFPHGQARVKAIQNVAVRSEAAILYLRDWSFTWSTRQDFQETLLKKNDNPEVPSLTALKEQ